ncbi:MAG: hypothetical protein ACRDPE_11280, partial [Solirubrobacterales bacterium]
SGPAGAPGAVVGALPSGATVVGAYWTEDEISSVVSFGYRVSQPLAFRVASASTAAQCPGTLQDPKAAPGYFCVYQQALSNASGSSMTSRDPEKSSDGESGHTGAVLYLYNGATLSYGTWAATAP